MFPALVFQSGDLLATNKQRNIRHIEANPVPNELCSSCKSIQNQLNSKASMILYAAASHKTRGTHANPTAAVEKTTNRRLRIAGS